MFAVTSLHFTSQHLLMFFFLSLNRLVLRQLATAVFFLCVCGNICQHCYEHFFSRAKTATILRGTGAFFNHMLHNTDHMLQLFERTGSLLPPNNKMLSLIKSALHKRFNVVFEKCVDLPCDLLGVILTDRKEGQSHASRP